MKLFTCGNCGNTLYFENVRCEQCGYRVGFLPSGNQLIALVSDGDAFLNAGTQGDRYAYCANGAHAACNWLVPESAGPGAFCVACTHNETVPPLNNEENVRLWQVMERAKKRLFYSLLKLELPLGKGAQGDVSSLRFRFLVDEPTEGGSVMTGHDDGVITIALVEADDAERERRRTNMGEPYRTLLGHFRHEIGHYYWDALVDTGEYLEPFRKLFGDDREDYGQALERHYANGAPPDWPQHFISAYATSHPWEDFAETWAHYLHMVDAVDTALASRMGAETPSGMEIDIHFDPYRTTDFTPVVQNWIPLSLLLNDLNRAIGHADAYPFVLSPTVQAKLSFIHALVHGQSV
ncbi:MAG TPA: putative zinc-binding peptidase [Devosia sp.]|jgi:hypothetical protein|uniref:zinc-binding metallopeptidase family protein n=1 Tax=Devosia sp. TaxID=1871048 RepID=UPI002F91F105